MDYQVILSDILEKYKSILKENLVEFMYMVLLYWNVLISKSIL